MLLLHRVSFCRYAGVIYLIDAAAKVAVRFIYSYTDKARMRPCALIGTDIASSRRSIFTYHFHFWLACQRE